MLLTHKSQQCAEQLPVPRVVFESLLYSRRPRIVGIAGIETEDAEPR
jgi:hypothetical protein